MHELECPTCGRRPLDEFSFGGERRSAPSQIDDPEARDFDEVWIFDNPRGVATERWFHAAGTSANGSSSWMSNSSIS